MERMERKDIERAIIKTYRKELWSAFTRAVRTYDLIRDGDKIACCISGGKDSTLLAKLFQEMLRHGKKNFDVVFLVMNPGYNDNNLRLIQENAAHLGIPIEVFDSDIFAVVDEADAKGHHLDKNRRSKTSSPCYLCARMRRGALYDRAGKLGCNKIALGHHYDDVIETSLMGMLYGGQIQTMMPKLRSTNFPGMELIRPLYLVREHDILRWKEACGLQFIRCACRLTEKWDPTAEGAGEALLPDTGYKRLETKRLIAELKKRSPYIESNIFKSVENVHLGAITGYKDREGKRHSFLDEYT